MDSIFIQMHIIEQEKTFLLIKSEITQVTTSVGTSANLRNYTQPVSFTPSHTTWVSNPFPINKRQGTIHSYLTLHFPFGVLYKEPLGYIEEEELMRNETIDHFFHSLLVLEFASLCPLEHFVFFPSFPFLVRFLSRDGGLRWWRPRWRTQFLRFADVPTEVVTCVIYDLINRNIFSYLIMCI